ncbi:MAG: hypothetical protein AAF564_00580 [Bacteroidota bacterium]
MLALWYFFTFAVSPLDNILYPVEQSFVDQGFMNSFHGFLRLVTIRRHGNLADIKRVLEHLGEDVLATHKSHAV